ncbi:MAG TPA: sporulation protein Cse60 [Candidatus Saccharimonadales bacterium]|nr:sporulation protein Cse60 [Candidatus Saccharimonadales bacterium]
MTRVKIYDNQQLSDLEKNINEFLKKEELKQLIDIKFSAISKNDVDKYAALIVYEENMSPGKEDPQLYE